MLSTEVSCSPFSTNRVKINLVKQQGGRGGISKGMVVTSENFDYLVVRTPRNGRGLGLRPVLGIMFPFVYNPTYYPGAPTLNCFKARLDKLWAESNTASIQSMTITHVRVIMVSDQSWNRLYSLSSRRG